MPDPRRLAPALARPLREALDWLRDQIDPFFEARASAHPKIRGPPDAYAAVVLDRSAERLDEFFAAHARAPLDAAARVEMRAACSSCSGTGSSYTSCGWFFDEISAIEPVQNLRYAALALQYLDDLGGGRLEDGSSPCGGSAAPSNVAELRDGARSTAA